MTSKQLKTPRPRPRYVGDTYHVIRWTIMHHPLLRPSDTEIRQIQAFCIGAAAERTGVQVHAVTYVHDHMECIVTDPGPTPMLAVFFQFANKWVSQCTNVKLSRFDQLWGSGSYDAPRLETEEAILDAIAGVMAAPTVYGLVRDPREWEGLCAKPRDIGTGMRVERPEVGFGKKSELPDAVVLNIVPPPCFANNVESYRARVSMRYNELIWEARDRIEAEGKKFLGMKRCAKMAIDQEFKSERAEEIWRDCRSLDRRQSWDGPFMERYKEARREFMDDKSTLFPKGTYWFWVMANVAIDWDEGPGMWSPCPEGLEEGNRLRVHN